MAFASDKTRQGTAGVSTGGYSIDNSLRFNDDDNSQLERTFTSAGDRQKWTWSAWIKRGNISTNMCLFSAKANTGMIWLAGVNGIMRVEQYNGAGGYNFRRNFEGYHRDASAWYHLIIVYDSAQASEVDRLKFYRNGEAVGVNYTYESMSQNFQSEFNNTETHWLGAINHGFDYDGLLAEVNFVDGQALTPSDFGETGDYGEWKAKKYTGTYGTNGFYLDFKNSGSLGNDANGSNNWTVNNLAATDQMLDSPTNNFCTWNPVSNSAGGLAALSEGNLRYNPNGTSSASGMFGTIGVNSGKWYFEVYRKTAGNGFHTGIAGYSGSTRKNYLVYSGQYYYGDNNTTMGWASPGANGEIISCAFDLDNNKIWFARNNVWKGSGNPSAGSGETDTLTAGLTSVSAYTKHANASYTGDDIHNFGQDSSFSGFKTAQGNADDNGIGDFYYTPPTGYLALCTQNLPEPTVVPSEHFNTVIHTGTGSTQSITGVGFAPDFRWTKSRANTYAHLLHDNIRGETKYLQSNTVNAEATLANLSLDSDGFTVHADDNGSTEVSWLWKANGSGSSNTVGDINSTVSANVDAGFSIVSYTGNDNGTTNTIGHGLSQAPELVFSKRRNTGGYHWMTGYNIDGTDHSLYLNSSYAADNELTRSPQAFTATTFRPCSIGSNPHSNGIEPYIAYCFHSVEGYSKVGSYTGNGSTDGTFVHCGFRPAYVMIKRTDAANNWIILDSIRDTFNDVEKQLLPNVADSEYTVPNTLDLTSNGFKLRDTNSSRNASGGTYIYLAFAESDFKHSNAR